MFVGMSFLSEDKAFMQLPTNTDLINNLTLTGGIYDNLFGTSNADILHSFDSLMWDFYTKFYANFENSLHAGNIEFSASTVSNILIKRRKSGTYNWITLFSIPIIDNSSFIFERFDYLARGNTEYDYAIVPVINGIEGNINQNSVKSDFNDYYLLDKENVYNIGIETELSLVRNRNSSVINTLGKKKPYVIYNGNNNYYSGSFKCMFLRKNNCELDVENSWEYREKVDEFLTNGQPKIFKDWEGRMYIIDVVDSIQHSPDGHYQKIVSEFNFVEVGDPENQIDLYENNLIDVPKR